MRICHDERQCLFGPYPTLAELGRRMGRNVPRMWLIPQLYNLSEYCGVRDKLTDEQMDELAYVIASEFAYLRISEIMLFLHRFKGGRYGRFYGTVDPLVVTTALRDFLRERADAIDRHQRCRHEQQADDERHSAVTYEEYLRLKEQHRI